MNINIMLHGTGPSQSYSQVIKAIKRGDESIITHCVNFFDFQYLKKGYEVTAYNSHGYVSLSGLLDNDGTYTNKEIRIQHNAMNMLIAGAFKFK